MKLGAFVRWSVFALALIAAGGAVALYGYEKSGALAQRAARELQEATGEAIAFEAVELDWFRPGVRVRGLQLPGDPSPLRLEEVYVELDWDSGAFRVAFVELSGGRVELSDALLARLQAMRAHAASQSAATPGATRVPPVVVEHVLLDWVHPQWGTSGIGWVDAVYREGSDGAPEIQGRIRPSFASVGEGATPEIYLAGSRDTGGRIALRATCNGVPVSSEVIPPRSPLEPLRAWKPRAALAFDLEASFQLDSRAPPAGRLRAQITGGSLELPTTSVPVTDVALDLDAVCAAGSLAGLLDPRAWTSTLHAGARWSGIPLDAWALFGTNAGAGHSARAWIHAPRVPLQRSTAEVAGSPKALTELFDALDLAGTADILCGVRWPETRSIQDDRAVASPEIAVDIDPRGDASACTHGWLDGTGSRRDGFPMRVNDITGRVVMLHDQGGTRATLIGLLEILGAHSDGTVTHQPGFADGLIRAPLAGESLPSFDLRVGGHGIPVDAAMERALLGIPGAEFIFPEFNPSGGSASILARLVRREGYRYPAAEVVVELFGCDGEWNELPIGLRDVGGRIDFLADPRGYVATGFDLRLRSSRDALIDVRGRIQDLPDPQAETRPWHERHFEAVAVDVRGISLRGDDRDSLASKIPEIGSILDGLKPTGRVDVHYRGATPRAGGPRVWRGELLARDAELLPTQFQVALDKVHGRVLLDGAMQLGPKPLVPDELDVSVAPLVAQFASSVTVAAQGAFPSHADGRIEILAAGVDPTHGGLSGAFRSSRTGGIGGGHAGLALSSLGVDGRVDFSGAFTIPQASPRAPESDYRVFLRQNDVRTTAMGGRLALGRLVGILEQTRDGVLAGESITATLAETPIRLSGVRFEQSGDSFRVETALDALKVGIDREHLRTFLDDSTLESLLDDLEWRGEMDVLNAKLVLSGAGIGGERAQFSGDIVPRGMSIDFGVPLSVESARVRIVDLSYTRESVSALLEVSELAGSIADRRLENAAFRLEYDDPGLRITDFAGTLENGRIASLTRGSGSRPAFALDLAPPYRFSVALQLDSIEVGGLLRGVFESDFASRGKLLGELMLDGDLARLTGVRGSGRFEIEDTVLWSVPVVRDLLSQLGLESGAVFEHVESEIEIEGGRLRMRNLLVESPLIKLVGAGTLDFDGSLEYDLEVQYQILDWLGWFNRIIYWVQNSLVRVAIRGDMARPRVLTKGAFGRSVDPRRGPRDLPLPNLSSLPERF
ncbi:MAG: hypothetical protein IT454_07035 [Planctomycetes bacterium]|nr:hypothetical protein [Planctomycetota bacterium]